MSPWVDCTTALWHAKYTHGENHGCKAAPKISRHERFRSSLLLLPPHLSFFCLGSFSQVTSFHDVVRTSLEGPSGKVTSFWCRYHTSIRLFCFLFLLQQPCVMLVTYSISGKFHRYPSFILCKDSFDVRNQQILLAVASYLSNR